MILQTCILKPLNVHVAIVPNAIATEDIPTCMPYHLRPIPHSIENASRSIEVIARRYPVVAMEVALMATSDMHYIYLIHCKNSRVVLTYASAVSTHNSER